MIGYHIIFGVLLAIALLTGVGTLGADMVILKSGEMFKTPRAWKENGMVNYYKNGRVVRVDEKEVDRLIHSPKPATDQPSAEHRPADGPPPPSEAPAVGRSTHQQSAKSVSVERV